MRWIVGSSLKFRFLVAFAAATMMAVGIASLGKMPVDVFPEFAPPRVEVQTVTLGLSAAETEELVTVPLEQTFSGVRGIDEIRSTSVPQLSSIELIFDQGTDLLDARQLVAERLAEATPHLPTWAAPPMLRPPLSATARIMKIGITSNRVSLMRLSTIAYWKIRTRLLRVPGVANVAIWGERLQQMHVQVDPKRLAENRVSLNNVMAATSDSLEAGLLRYSDGAVIGTGGFVDTPNQRLAISNVSPIASPRDLSRVSVENGRGTALRLADLARVKQGHQPLHGDAIVNGGPGLLLVVEKFPGANTLDVTRGVEDAVDELRPGLSGITIDTTIFRPADFIETAIDNLTTALLIGSLLVVLVLVAFLFEWRTAAISLVAIPLSLMAAVLVLDLTGASINVMVLAGLVIAVGVVVDDAIIDVENIWRRLRQGGGGAGLGSIARTILEASLEVRTAILYATIINIVAVVPVFFLEGVTGSFFRPLALSYALALLVSMAVALTVTPALSLILLPRTRLDRGDAPLVRWLKRGYEAVLLRIIHRPGAAYATVGVTVLLGVATLPQLGEELFPEFKERDFLMHWVSKPDTSVREEARIVRQGSDDLRSIPGVRNFGSHIGQAFLAEEVVGVNFGENWISVDPNADYDETTGRIEDVVDSYPGLFHDVQTYLRERIDEVLVGESEPLIVRIFGDDLETLRREAKQVRQKLSDVEGLDDLHVELQVDNPQVDVEVDLARAQRYGLKPGDVRRNAATLVESEEVGDIFRGGRAYDVHVWSTPATRNNFTDIGALPIDTPGGGQIRLDDTADVRIRPTPNVVHREGGSRRIDVGANITGRDLGSIADDVQSRLDQIKFPTGYHAELLGEAAERQNAASRTVAFGIAAAFAILLLLHAAFGSWRLTLMAFLTLPTALVGGLLAAYIGGGIISIGSLVGFLTVLGIAARNGIMLISHYQHLERREGEQFGPDLVLRGAKERLSPILMTALAAGLALLPLVVLGTRPGHEIEHPMAVVIVGGLVTSTLLNLFIIPALYLRFGRDGRFRLKGESA
jgi:CzcA family heavy metal efflux pump